jgi:DNA-binding transcriptional MocR family regulator
VRLSNPEGGLQLTARLPEVADDGPLRAALNAAGFAISSLSDYFLDRPAQGLVIGFGTATAREARRFAETLVRHLDSHNRP